MKRKSAFTRLAKVTSNGAAHPLAFVAWFAVAAVLIVPLPIFLAAVPASRLARRAEACAVVGLGMGGVGYVLLHTLALRLALPHVQAAYLWSAGILGSHALLVACWHNSRQGRLEQEDFAGSERCDDSAL